jgi:hypothetical protein
MIFVKVQFFFKSKIMRFGDSLLDFPYFSFIHRNARFVFIASAYKNNTSLRTPTMKCRGFIMYGLSLPVKIEIIQRIVCSAFVPAASIFSEPMYVHESICGGPSGLVYAREDFRVRVFILRNLLPEDQQVRYGSCVISLCILSPWGWLKVLKGDRAKQGKSLFFIQKKHFQCDQQHQHGEDFFNGDLW